MSLLAGKKILMGVCASISAYKAALLTRLLVKEGAEVRIVMTKKASEFITPLTLATLSKNPVLTDFVKNKEGIWNNHVELGLWADVFLVAPISENTLAKFANGLCDNLLTATYFSMRAPVVIAPAMDLDMYQHPATVRNLGILKSYGNHVIEATNGELASGLTGKGRLEEPENIVAWLIDFFEKKEASSQKPLQNKKIVITAGATKEPIDPVRYLTNHSSGKMGYALAQKAQEMGANVVLVSSANLPTPAQVQLEKVSSANEMLKAVEKHIQDTDIFIFAAAVADYRPSTVASTKIKKQEGIDQMVIQLVKNPDIAATIGAKKQSKQFLVGFALETDNELENALRKLDKKNLDMIVLNSLQDEGAGFGHDTNKISIIDHKDKTDFDLKTKDEVAVDILKAIIDKLHYKTTGIKKFEINKET